MSNEATTMAEAMERKHSEPATPAPSALEIEAYALTVNYSGLKHPSFGGLFGSHRLF